MESIIDECNLIFITTPDDIISEIDREISKFQLNNKHICHCSGSLSSDILFNAKHADAEVYSIHPMFAFSSKDIPLEDLKEMYFSVDMGNIAECNNPENSLVIKMLNSLPNKYFIRKPETSSLYHLSNVMASNMVLSLINIAAEYLTECGLSEEDALKSLKPLICRNIESIFSKGFKKAVTGPVARNDIQTVIKHKNVIKNKHKNLYNVLSLNLLNILLEEETDIQKEYSQMINILKE